MKFLVHGNKKTGVVLAHTRPDKKREKESKFDYSNYIQARQINTQTAFFNIGGKDFVLLSRLGRTKNRPRSGPAVRQVVRPILPGQVAAGSTGPDRPTEKKRR